MDEKTKVKTKMKLNLQFHAVSFNKTQISYKEDATYTKIEGLQEVPELGGDPEKIDVTTLDDQYKKYIPGIEDLGDLAFKFLYDNSTVTSNYRVMKELADKRKAVDWKVEYPDGSVHSFTAYVSVKLGGGGVNTPVDFTANMFLESDIETDNPAED